MMAKPTITELEKILESKGREIEILPNGELRAVESETMVFSVQASPRILRRFHRLLALLHYSSSFGHSGIFGMPLDGDGNDEISVEPRPPHQHEVDAVGSVGYDVELATDVGYSGLFKNHQKECPWASVPTATLFKDGKQIKTIPSTINDKEESK